MGRKKIKTEFINFSEIIAPKEKHHLFMDGSGEGSITNFNHQISVLIIIKEPRDIIKLDKLLNISKKPKECFKNVFKKREYHFNEFMKDGTKPVLDYLTEKIKLLMELASLEIRVKVIKKESLETDCCNIHQERINLLLAHTNLHYPSLIKGHTNFKIFSDKNFFQKENKILSIITKEGGVRIFLHHGTPKILADTQVDFEIKQIDSRKSKGVQLADLISGSIFQKYERKNNSFYDLIKHKIIVLEEI